MARTATAPGAARREKRAAVDDVRSELERATATLLTEYRGLTVAELAQLRAELRRNDARYRVAKNTLVRLAVREAGFDVPDELLTGPTAITFCAGDPVSAAKVLRTFGREHPELIIKGGIFEGRLLDAAEAQRLADLESREELLAKFAGMLQSAIAQPAQLAAANLAKVARLMGALREQRAAAGEGAQAALDTEASPEPPPGPDAEASSEPEPESGAGAGADEEAAEA